MIRFNWIHSNISPLPFDKESLYILCQYYLQILTFVTHTIAVQSAWQTKWLKYLVVFVFTGNNCKGSLPISDVCFICFVWIWRLLILCALKWRHSGSLGHRNMNNIIIIITNIIIIIITINIIIIIIIVNNNIIKGSLRKEEMFKC